MIKTYRIGNWSIQEDGIKWVGDPDTNTLIPKDDLLDAGTNERKQMYDWMVHLTVYYGELDHLIPGQTDRGNVLTLGLQQVLY